MNYRILIGIPGDVRVIDEKGEDITEELETSISILLGKEDQILVTLDNNWLWVTIGELSPSIENDKWTAFFFHPSGPKVLFPKEFTSKEKAARELADWYNQRRIYVDGLPPLSFDEEIFDGTENK